MGLPDIEALAFDAVETFGESSQLRQLKEELAELIVAISHYERNREGAMLEMCLEVVDVTFMLIQFSEMFEEQMDDLDEDAVAAKFQKLADRIAAHKAKKTT
jgi:NTP pyrophosphatase (non-canonical NTP hydrolase)